MPSFAHKKIVKKIQMIDELPSDDAQYLQWVGASQHLEFLKQNAIADETVIYGSGPYTFIHSIVVPDEALEAASQDDLLRWSCNPYVSIASYVSGGGRRGMWIERDDHHRGSKALDQGRDLIFARTFEGWSGDGRDYIEVNQEYTHLTGVHWRPEENAYCRFDDHGDLRHCASVTLGRSSEDVRLVSFTWEELEEYLTIARCSLVRMFDFTLLKHSEFNGWPDNIDEMVHVDSADFFYRQRHCGRCAYTRGIQIMRPRRGADQVFQGVTDGWSGNKSKQYVEFIAHDWRNERLAKISTDPAATTNYFEAEGNDLPFELSPAFFRAEVLSKYKTDREKYTIKDREVSCRAAWHLRGYDVNEAGQVHAYICDLRALPYTEQLHWLAFNVEPQAGISERAIINDFQGDFVTFRHPREEVMSIVRRWRDRKVEWWKLRDSDLMDRANIPLTASKDEWAEAVMDLTKLVVEGFETKPLRQRLDRLSVEYTDSDRTLALLEKLLNVGRHRDEHMKLSGLREAQWLRSKLQGHARGTEAAQAAKDAIANFGSFKDHFSDLCTRIAAELQTIESQCEAEL